MLKLLIVLWNRAWAFKPSHLEYTGSKLINRLTMKTASTSPHLYHTFYRTSLKLWQQNDQLYHTLGQIILARFVGFQNLVGEKQANKKIPLNKNKQKATNTTQERSIAVLLHNQGYQKINNNKFLDYNEFLEHTDCVKSKIQRLKWY